MEMMYVDERKSKAWYAKSHDPYDERGQYVAHNGDVRYSPTY